MDELDLTDGYGDRPLVHAIPLGKVYPCCLRRVTDLGADALVGPPDAVTCPGRGNWHRGDRCRVREDGRHGIVEGWKGDQLLVFWGSMNGQDYRDWVPEVDCDWMPQPKISSG